MEKWTPKHSTFYTRLNDQRIRELSTKAEIKARKIFSFVPKSTFKRTLLSTCMIVAILSLSFLLCSNLNDFWHWLRGNRLVIVTPRNIGGGVTNWRNPRETALEKISHLNKIAYSRRHGYTIEFVDMHEQRKYSHEWRESWAKIDAIRWAMNKHRNAEWFWWLDRTTYIMEIPVSIEDHVLSLVPNNLVRDITAPQTYNPLEMEPIEGEKYDGNVNLILTQDCGGFSLGSFLIRRSEWTERLLDIWWDPAFYKLKHMEWDHDEQDALQDLYRNQAWIRNSVAFVAQRRINSYCPGACAGFENDKKFFYSERDRDFVVNMAGCEWGRDCLREMRTYWELARKKQHR